MMNSLIHGFENGSGEGRIMIMVRLECQRFLMDYSDTVICIPPDILNQVFEPFFTTNRAHCCLLL